MADKVQRVMEDMVPELLDLGKRKVFSKEEIREIVRRRRGFEYKIASRTPTLRDYLEYLNYEYELERIRNTRTRAMKLKKRTIGDYSIIRLIHFIFKRALRRFPSDEKLWLQNIDFCLKSGSSKALQRSLISALKHNPTNSVFWLIMSDRELQNGNAKEARSAILLGLRVNKESLILWRGFSQLETNITYRKYLDCFSSSELAIKKGFQDKNSSVMSLIPILSHGLKRIKLEHKKEAHLLFILRQYYKLYRVLSENGDFSRIGGMKELEDRILDSINQGKKSQPLFPVFGIVLEIYRDEQADIFDHFKSEIDQVICSSNTEFALFSLIFICKLIYNCTNPHYIECNLGDVSDALSEAINQSSIVEFGFDISESIQDLNDPTYPSVGNNHPVESCLHPNMNTWYSQTCLENLHYRDNLHIKKAVNLLKLDPNFWNCCFLEGSATENLIKKLSSYSVPSIEEREIWKEKLFSKEQIEHIRQRIISYLSHEPNKTRFAQFISDLKEKIEKLTIAPESQDIKLSLLEALDSLFAEEQSSRIKNHMSEDSFIGDSPNQKLLQIQENIPHILQVYKQFIMCHGTSHLSPEHAIFVTKSVNRLLDLIQAQVENDEKQSASLDFIGFSKSIFWTLYIISINSRESKEKNTPDILELRQRIIFFSLNVFPRWFSINKIPGFLFNVLIIYSILKSTEKMNSSLSSILVDYLNSKETGPEVRFELSPIIKILKDSTINDELLIHATEILLELSNEHRWLVTNDITLMPKGKKDAISITFMLSCISLLYLLFERYLENCMSRVGKPYQLKDLDFQNRGGYLTSKLFSMLNSLLTYIADLDNFFSEEYKLNIHIRYLLLVKLAEHFKVKRIFPPKLGECLNGPQIPSFSGLLSQLNKSSPHIHSGKLPSGINLATISTLSVEDPQFEFCLKKVSSLEEGAQETSETSDFLASPHATLYKVMQNILNPCQLLAPTSAYFKNSYL